MNRRYSFLRCALILICLAPFLRSGAAAGTVRALLVGIGDYPAAVGPMFPDLEGPPNDLKMMADWLGSDLGIPESSIATLSDVQATSGNIQKAMERHLIQGCKPDDVAIFYFSGHGTQVADLGPEKDEDDEMDEALVTADFNESDPSTWLTDDVIYRQLAAVPARNVIVLFDACTTGTGTRGIKGAASSFDWNTRSALKPDSSLREKRSPANQFFFAACGDGELARQVYDSPSGGVVGVFTLGFRQLMAGPKGTGTLGEFEIALQKHVDRLVREKINENLGQRPVIQAASKDMTLLSLLSDPAASSAPARVTPAPGVIGGFTSDGPIRVTLTTNKDRYLWTEELVAEITVDQPAYVRVFHVDTTGEIAQIHPNAILGQRQLRPGETLRLPPTEPVNGRIYPLRVTGPNQGMEALIAVASTQPFTDREAREFTSGLFNPIPNSSPAQTMTRGITVEGRADTASETTAARGQAVRIYRTSQF